MTGGLALRLGERLIGWACYGLPEDLADERCREWTAELPAILRDPGVRSPLRRTIAMLVFAADQSRGTRPLCQALRAAWASALSVSRNDVIGAATSSAPGLACLIACVVAAPDGASLAEGIVFSIVLGLCAMAAGLAVLRAEGEAG